MKNFDMREFLYSGGINARLLTENKTPESFDQPTSPEGALSMDELVGLVTLEGSEDLIRDLFGEADSSYGEELDMNVTQFYVEEVNDYENAGVTVDDEDEGEDLERAIERKEIAIAVKNALKNAGKDMIEDTFDETDPKAVVMRTVYTVQGDDLIMRFDERDNFDGAKLKPQTMDPGGAEMNEALDVTKVKGLGAKMAGALKDELDGMNAGEEDYEITRKYIAKFEDCDDDATAQKCFNDFKTEMAKATDVLPDEVGDAYIDLLSEDDGIDPTVKMAMDQAAGKDRMNEEGKDRQAGEAIETQVDKAMDKLDQMLKDGDISEKTHKRLSDQLQKALDAASEVVVDSKKQVDEAEDPQAVFNRGPKEFGTDDESQYQYVAYHLAKQMPAKRKAIQPLISDMLDAMDEDDKVAFDMAFVKAMKIMGKEDMLRDEPVDPDAAFAAKNPTGGIEIDPADVAGMDQEMKDMMSEEDEPTTKRGRGIMKGQAGSAPSTTLMLGAAEDVLNMVDPTEDSEFVEDAFNLLMTINSEVAAAIGGKKDADMVAMYIDDQAIKQGLDRGTALQRYVDYAVRTISDHIRNGKSYQSAPQTLNKLLRMNFGDDGRLAIM